jgi:hypothetical protein
VFYIITTLKNFSLSKKLLSNLNSWVILFNVIFYCRSLIMSWKRTNIGSLSLRPLPKTQYAIFLLSVLVLGACRDSGGPASPNEPNESAVAGSLQPNETSLFDGRTLGRWKITDFGGQGNVYVKDGSIFMEMGNDMTGIHWTGPVVRMNYEISLEAMRVTGSDFFCGLTFPVGENPCSLILGGWGGEVCGLSNLDYYDAANNETTRIISFETGRWYRVRLRVTPNKIEAWLDDEKLVDVVTTGRKIDIRPEVDLSQPLGIATWQTTGAVRNIRLQTLTDISDIL